MAWDRNSPRRATLPPGWAKLRLAILDRDNWTCRLRLRGCATAATEVHHTGHPTDHRPEKLLSACNWCHRMVTQQQAAAARRPMRQARPTEQHPGLT